MKGSSAASRWGRCLKAPVRVLRSVPDLYIKCMNGCAGRVRCGGGTMVYQATLSEFSHSYDSFSSRRTSASDKDHWELVGGVSRTQMRVRRNRSFVMGRIDEDAPCEFREDVKVGSWKRPLVTKMQELCSRYQEKRRTRAFAN